MSNTLKAQLRATYTTCRKLGLLACEAYAIARVSIRFPAKREHYKGAFYHVAQS